MRPTSSMEKPAAAGSELSHHQPGHQDSGYANLSRRELLKLAGFFALASGLGLGGSDSIWAATPSAPAVPASGADSENGYALSGTSNFHAIYQDPKLRAAFYLFLQNVFHLYPEDALHELIERIARSEATDRGIYLQLQKNLPSIKPLLSEVRYALPALWKQKEEMTRQTLALLSARRKVNGFLELGSTGRYISHLQSRIELNGDIVLAHTEAPTYSPVDLAERGQLSKIGRYVALNDYAPISSADVPDRSLDLVGNYIGFHHAPPDKRDRFVQSIQRVLRPGGRLILRDHDVNTPQMNRMVALAHDVFNMGITTPWSTNQQEVRNFTAMTELIPYLETQGFKHSPTQLLQSGDPTQNTLMEFTRI